MRMGSWPADAAAHLSQQANRANTCSHTFCMFSHSHHQIMHHSSGATHGSSAAIRYTRLDATNVNVNTAMMRMGPSRMCLAAGAVAALPGALPQPAVPGGAAGGLPQGRAGRCRRSRTAAAQDAAAACVSAPWLTALACGVSAAAGQVASCVVWFPFPARAGRS